MILESLNFIEDPDDAKNDLFPRPRGAVGTLRRLILIVAGHADLGQADGRETADLLHHLGYDTQTASSAGGALKMVDEGRISPDLIVVDLTSSGSHDPTFSPRLRLGLLWNAVPAIAFSALADPRQVQAALRNGYRDLILASAPMATIKTKIERAILSSYANLQHFENRLVA